MNIAANLEKTAHLSPNQIDDFLDSEALLLLRRWGKKPIGLQILRDKEDGLVAMAQATFRIIKAAAML